MLALSQANIVVLARKFNPSIVSNEWLAEKGIITEPIGQFVHTEVLSLVEAESLSLVLDEGRLQVALKAPASSNLNQLADSVKQFIHQLPETPYRAVGLNFAFTIDEASLARNPILNPAPERMQALFGDIYQLGARVTFPVNGFTAKLELPPAGLTDKLAEASFNFHASVAGMKAALDSLDKHAAAFDKAESIMKEIARNGD